MSSTLTRGSYIDDRTVVVDAMREIEDKIEEARADVASLYINAPARSVLEFELGESLQAIRKALARVRKAQVALAQLELPMEVDG